MKSKNVKTHLSSQFLVLPTREKMSKCIHKLRANGIKEMSNVCRKFMLHLKKTFDKHFPNMNNNEMGFLNTDCIEDKSIIMTMSCKLTTVILQL